MESRREGGLTGQKRAIESSKKRPREMGEREGERMDGILGGGEGEGKRGQRRAEGDLAQGRQVAYEIRKASFWIAKMRP